MKKVSDYAYVVSFLENPELQKKRKYPELWIEKKILTVNGIV